MVEVRVRVWVNRREVDLAPSIRSMLERAATKASGKDPRRGRSTSRRTRSKSSV